jgi:outer membrane protein OmpA-like peptidoglycan-associated protein
MHHEIDCRWESFLIGKGVAEGELNVKGLGIADPRGDNGTAAGRAENRRVEIQLRVGS